MIGLLRTSLAARSSAVVLGIVGVVGIGFLTIAIPLTKQLEEERQHLHLHELLDTVENALSIACFLSDRQLADEIAEGLLSNRTVLEVEIRAGDQELIRRGRAGAITGARRAKVIAQTAEALTHLVNEPLTFNVESPFTPGEVVGEITLVPDVSEIRRNVWREVQFIALLVLVQVAVTGLGVMVIVIRYIARPISGLSDELHALRAESGQKLAIPRGNEADEIGRLARDVNTMAGNMVTILNEERELRLQHQIEEQKFRAIFEHADTGIFLIDEAGTLISDNPAFARLFNIADAASRVGHAPKFIDLIGEHKDAVADLIVHCVADALPLSLDLKLGGKPGIPARWVSVVLSPIEGKRLQGVVNDVTERKLAEDAAQELAVTDHLTGLGNRLGFERRLKEMIEQGYRRPRSAFSLLMMDLDHFKEVNDTHGHKAGDEVLVAVARRLEQVVRKTDFVCRLGGDEFVVLLTSMVEPLIIENINRKIIAAVGQPIAIGDGKSAQVGVSIGAAIFGDPPPTQEEFVRRADVAMYAAKRAGRNTWRFHGEPAPA